MMLLWISLALLQALFAGVAWLTCSIAGLSTPDAVFGAGLVGGHVGALVFLVILAGLASDEPRGGSPS